MKLRIQGDSLRLRLTRSEVAGLHETGAVEETAHFAGGGGLTYRIRKTAAGDSIRAELTDGAITVLVPAGTVEAWATSEEVGLAARDGVLRIAIEKDFRCLTRAREEDEADAYPHPAERWNC
jgi:hypothetical protein